MPKYYEGQFLKFIGNALKENAVILTCMSAFSHIILMVNFATGRDFAFKKKSPILPIIYETKRGIKIRNKNYSFFMYKQSKRTPFRV